MENQVSWHGAAPNKEQYDVAMQELTAALQELEAADMAEMVKKATRESFG